MFGMVFVKTHQTLTEFFVLSVRTGNVLIAILG